MTKKSAREWLATIIIGIFSLFLIAGLIAALECHGLASSEAAGWIQAIGSVGAIVGSIWVMAEQHRRDEKRRTDEAKLKERRLLKSILTEVDVLFAAFRQTTGDALAKAKKGDIFDVYYRVPPNPFAVFDSHVGQIGVVENDDVRRLIILTYAKFNGVLTIISMNNDVVNEKDAEFKARGGVLPPDRLEVFRGRMAHLANQAIDRYAEAAACVEQIRIQLGRY